MQPNQDNQETSTHQQEHPEAPLIPDGKVETTPKSKKKIIWISVGLTVFIAVAVIIPLATKKKEDNPPNPYDYQEFNPY